MGYGLWVVHYVHIFVNFNKSKDNNIFSWWDFNIHRGISISTVGIVSLRAHLS